MLLSCSVHVRGRLAATVSVLLRFPEQTIAEPMNPLAGLVGYDSVLRAQDLHDYTRTKVAVVEQHAHDVVDVLCDDAVLAPVHWRLAALQTLTHVLRQLQDARSAPKSVEAGAGVGPLTLTPGHTAATAMDTQTDAFASASGRDGFSEVVQGLQSRGTITRLMEAFGSRTPLGTAGSAARASGSGGCGGAAADAAADQDLLSATLDVFTVMAARAEGAAALVHCDILPRVINGSYAVPQTTGAAATATGHAGHANNAHNDLLPPPTTVLLSAVRCLLAMNTSLGTVAVADATAAFLVTHRRQLSSLLGLLDLDSRASPKVEKRHLSRNST